MRRLATFLTLALIAPCLLAQAPNPALQHAPAPTMIPLPELPPGTLELLQLEGKFSEAVSKGGGKAFVAWLSDDAVTLNDGKPAVIGKAAIAATANWDAKDYQLSWFAEGAQMAPSGDAGFTWGHYDAAFKDKDGLPATHSGRYFTFWKKVNGQWKVALDASASEPPAVPGSVLGELPPPK
jgi:ketosteroid isomerase-like protein